MFVPVVDSENIPLTPTKPSRARRWVSSGKATPFWKNGIWCVRLNHEPSTRNIPKIVVGIDPGSKMEGFTVKSNHHTYINIQSHAVVHVKKRIEIRRNSRRLRRQRNAPYRKPILKTRRKKGFLPPSTKTRWDAKLRVLNFLSKIFPISDVVVEDIFATTRGKSKNWNLNFSPLQIGKSYFYKKIREKFNLYLYRGYETKELREKWNLKKSEKKLSVRFESHCVDSWAMANDWSGGHASPDNKEIYELRFIPSVRRKLHYRDADKNGVRRRFGGTMILGFKKNSIVRHSRRGVCLIGGVGKRGMSLHCPRTHRRICRTAKPEDTKFLAYNSFVIRKVE